MLVSGEEPGFMSVMGMPPSGGGWGFETIPPPATKAERYKVIIMMK